MKEGGEDSGRKITNHGERVTEDVAREFGACEGASLRVPSELI